AATVTGQLTALLRTRADEAQQREREAEALAEASWAVASQVDRGQALAEVLRRLANVVEPEAAAIMVPNEENGPTAVAEFERAGAPPEAGGSALFQTGRGPARQAVEFVLEQGGSIGWEGQSRHWEKALAQTEHPDAMYLPLTTESRVL